MPASGFLDGTAHSHSCKQRLRIATAVFTVQVYKVQFINNISGRGSVVKVSILRLCLPGMLFHLSALLPWSLGQSGLLCMPENHLFIQTCLASSENVQLKTPSLPFNRHHLSCDDCLQRIRGNEHYQNNSVLYTVYHDCTQSKEQTDEQVLTDISNYQSN